MSDNVVEKPKYSFDEFKLIYESAEKVTDRRLTKNSQNYSISVALVFAIGFIANWSLSNSQYQYAGYTLIAVISIMAAIYTKLWLRQILDFKSLNTAKFQILNEMAPNISFLTDEDKMDNKIISYEPFRREWEKMQGLNSLQKPKGRRFIAMKSTNEEIFVPNAFFVIFLLTSFASILAIGFHLNDFITTWNTVLFGT